MINWSVIFLFDILTVINLFFTEIMSITDIHHSNDLSVNYYSFIFMLVFNVALCYKNFPHRFEILFFLFLSCLQHVQPSLTSIILLFPLFCIWGECSEIRT